MKTNSVKMALYDLHTAVWFQNNAMYMVGNKTILPTIYMFSSYTNVVLTFQVSGSQFMSKGM